MRGAHFGLLTFMFFALSNVPMLDAHILALRRFGISSCLAGTQGAPLQSASQFSQMGFPYSYPLPLPFIAVELSMRCDADVQASG